MKSFFRKSLNVFMMICLLVLTFSLTTSVKAADTTITITYEDTFTPSFPTASASVNATDTLHTVNDFSFMEQGIYKGASAKYLMFAQNKGFLYNTVSLGTIKSIAVTYSDGVSTSAKIGVYFDDVAVSTYTTASNVTIAGRSATDTFTNEVSGNGFFQLSTSNKNCQITEIVIVYDDTGVSSEPSLSITNSKSSLMVGESHTFSYETNNIDTPSVTWSSLNPEFATINSTTGEVTAISQGEVTIVATEATASKTKDYTFKVFMSNANPITIEEALSICELTGTNETPYKYETFGTVKTAGNPFTITDGTNDIDVYATNSLTVGEKVKVTGNLKIYGETKEFAGTVTITTLHTVTFDSNGGSLVSALNDVGGGTTITEPTAPTKTGFTFIEWLKPDNTAWNFATDTVTEDITLTASWLDNAFTTFQSDLNTKSASMSMGYTYEVNPVAPVTDTLVASSLGVDGYANFSDVNFTTTAVYAGNCAKHTSGSIQMRTNNSNSGIITTTSGGYARKIIVTWNESTSSGRIIDVYGSHTAYTGTDASVLYNNATQGELLGSITCGTSTELEVSGNWEYIGLRSRSGALYATNIQIIWSSGAPYTDVDFRLRCGVDSSLATLAATLEDATYGIEVSDGTTTRKYLSNNEYFTTDNVNNISYVIIDLGDVLNNPSRINTVFTVRAFVTYDSDTMYSNSSCSYSVKDLVKYYHDMEIPEVNGLYSLLQELGYSFE